MDGLEDEELILKSSLEVPSTSKEFLGGAEAVSVTKLSHLVGVIDQVCSGKLSWRLNDPPNP